ncbi:MAG: Gfo/Idh/MocA family oxidoreductase [Kiritimatiellae bacterium]|nr:Gfo/Idh/MocA family oxidoreductase [Kiritimatiellia bacterium]
MINVGVIGLGTMGNTHLDVYAKRQDVKVCAISDVDPKRLSGEARAKGNIEGQAQGGFDLSSVRRYDDGIKLIRDRDVQLVDICLPTPLHLKYALAALRAGKHVLVEKPLARTARDAERLVRAADKAGTMIMPAMCMRFWPGWTWLREAVVTGRYGRVLAAHFRRVSSHPGANHPLYGDGKQCGGAILDLHIHDTDFVQWCFGMPRAVFSSGYRRHTSEVDHVMTRYDFGPDGPMVTAEGGWAMAPGFGFTMQFTVNFDQATAIFDLAAKPALSLCRDGQREPVAMPDGMGYEHEIAYLLDCIARKTPPSTVTIADGARSVRIVEAEAKSVASGRPVKVKS